MKKYALLTASDKTGIGELGRALERLGFSLVSTANTAKALREYCTEVTEVSALTGFPEILDGRVKTLHPVIHAGILADRDKAEHLQTLTELGIGQIDLVAVNLYPFAQTLLKPGVTEAEIIENIDVGGPALIRAAAKNFRHVLVLTDPEDYLAVLKYLDSGGTVSEEFRRQLAAKAFSYVSEYDTRIAGYLAQTGVTSLEQDELPQRISLNCRLNQALRYGENPHQQAGFYLEGQSGWRVLHGKELSYNNLQDIDASLRALRLFDEPTAVIVKHCVPCGIGTAPTLSAAYAEALAADPVSPFGGIVALNRSLDLETAELINHLFTEIVIAPEYAAGVLDFLQKKKNRRLIQYDPDLLCQTDNPWELKQLLRGYLLQQRDLADEPQTEWQVVTQRQPDSQEWEALCFGWKVVSLLRSNAIVLTGSDMVYGLGSGQTSRIDSLNLGVTKAHQFGHDLSSAVCASDGFFPFPDSIKALHQNGIRAVIQPGGSKADPEIIAACDSLGMAMVCTGFRHFRH